MTEDSQTDRVKKTLERYKYIDTVQAIQDMNILRLGAIIHVLRGRGMDIITLPIVTGKKYGRYVLK